ncbi:BtpA/SgcQ family protein [Neobacillus kokaensis]|uniref:BtpA family membrane complex biogenesis protein n=1 Tax=Neobacillus kokaensis TaxID=2759023 RepID=A0ABQ3N3R9_9BACI|nr:BtpA/SgcQ family protein [Neobacillus kokaensis]GHH98623.1 hypothetical protein AM1BK_21660 [Neobacillus kokaensis]
MFKDKRAPYALAMLQPEPMPGSFRHSGMPFEEIIQISVEEVAMLQRNGFDGYIIQNRNDAPVKQIANPETIAYMSVLGYVLKEKFPNMIQGILVNWDGVASLAVADAIGADFIRVEHLYTGVEVGYAGLLEAQCVDICNLKKKLGSKVPVFADVQEIHYEQIGRKEISAAAWDTIQNAFADGLFLGGKNADESIEIIQKIRKKIGGNVPVFLGGGATGNNIARLLEYYDGVSVGSWVKNGNMKNPIDEEKAKIFIAEVEKAKKIRH